MKHDCPRSPTLDHEYNPYKHSRDDQGFYVPCVHCGYDLFVPADTEDELLYDYFGEERDEEE